MDRLRKLNECVGKIERHENVLLTLQIMHEILETYPENANDNGVNDDQQGVVVLRWEIIKDLLLNSKILTHLVNDIEYFKQNVKNTVKNLSKDEIKDNNVDNNYLKQMTERINFLIHLISNIGSRTIDISVEQVALIWKLWALCIADSCTHSQETELTFQFIKQLISKCNTFQKSEVTNVLYKKHIIPYFNNIENIKYMGMDAYKCFRDCFLRGNYSAKTLLRH
eukprot:378876_1